MPKPRVNDTELDKIARFERIKKAITALEKQLAQISKQGDLAPEGAWVARYQVRQNQKKYVSVSKLANTIKTVTSREIRKRFVQELKPYYWKPVFWKRGYCAVSGGGATIDIIKSYIQSQGKDD